MTAYDEILYPPHAFPQAHPDRLAAHAILYGMKPVPIERCRVLEIGCGDGSHLIPMAYNLPDSHFVGIDLAVRPIELGREIINEVGLQNIRLEHLGIEDVTDDFGEFDYIITHGVYSWVPAEVREKMLAVYGKHLSPEGVGYVSYNAMPGGHLRQLIREMMLWRVRDINDPQERVEQARALIEMLYDAVEETDPYILLLKTEIERVRLFRPSYLFHDDLAEINTPFYFHEFIRQAGEHGLQYLAEADYSDMATHSLPAKTVDYLNQLTDDRIQLDQYADFFKCRRFRQTLLCRSQVALERKPKTDGLRSLYFSAPLEPEDETMKINERTVGKFKGEATASLATDSPLIKAAATMMGERWPQVLSFEELLSGARARTHETASANEEEDAQRLGSVLLEAYSGGIIRVHTSRPLFVTVPGERPRASLLARTQLQRGTLVVSQRHLYMEVKDQLGQNLLRLLDGTRNRAELIEEIAAAIKSGEIQLDAGNEKMPPAEQIIASLPVGLENSLKGLALSGMLEA